MPGIYRVLNCQYAETTNIWYSVKFEFEELIEPDEGKPDVEPEGSFDIISCMDINKSVYYVLKNDILDSSGIDFEDVDFNACIRITTPNVVIDGNGYTLDGVDRVGSAGIFVSVPGRDNNITIKNLVLSDWDIGIKFGGENCKIDNNIFTSNKDGLVLLSNTHNNTIENNVFAYNEIGIHALNSDFNQIYRNTIENNDLGIWIYSTRTDRPNNHNTISFCYIKNNLIGINISNSNNNLVYTNLLNNFRNAEVTDSTNCWNNPKMMDINIVGGSYIGGNAWYYPSGYGFSQTCADADFDRICDSVYQLNVNNKDNYPLGSPRPKITIKSVSIDNPISYRGYPGFFRVYTFYENHVKITVMVENTGEVDGKVLVKLENLPDGIGKQLK